MPTALELKTQVADETGMNVTTESSSILRALNRSIRRVVSGTDCLKSSGDVAGDASTVDLSLSSLTGLAAIDSAYLLSNGIYSQLPQRPIHSIMSARTRTQVSAYAFQGGSTLLLDGPTGAGNSVHIRYALRPTALTGSETEDQVVSASGIDPMFHEDLIAGFAVTHLLEGYEGEEERAAYYRQLAMDALQRFKQFLVDRGGNELPNSRGTDHFHTPSPLEIR